MRITHYSLLCLVCAGCTVEQSYVVKGRDLVAAAALPWELRERSAIPATRERDGARVLLRVPSISPNAVRGDPYVDPTVRVHTSAVDGRRTVGATFLGIGTVSATIATGLLIDTQVNDDWVAGFFGVAFALGGLLELITGGIVYGTAPDVAPQELPAGLPYTAPDSIAHPASATSPIRPPTIHTASLRFAF